MLLTDFIIKEVVIKSKTFSVLHTVRIGEDSKLFKLFILMLSFPPLSPPLMIFHQHISFLIIFLSSFPMVIIKPSLYSTACWLPVMTVTILIGRDNFHYFFRFLTYSGCSWESCCSWCEDWSWIGARAQDDWRLRIIWLQYICWNYDGDEWFLRGTRPNNWGILWAHFSGKESTSFSSQKIWYNQHRNGSQCIPRIV